MTERQRVVSSTLPADDARNTADVWLTKQCEAHSPRRRPCLTAKTTLGRREANIVKRLGHAITQRHVS